jgi:hypothetical protein
LGSFAPYVSDDTEKKLVEALANKVDRTAYNEFIAAGLI